MSTHSGINTRSPTIKRILKEASEITAAPSADYTAAPLETNLFEWHFTLRGPPEPSPFAKGIYHGRIVLPPTYPLRPPSFRFLTPSGRFETNREICLSISGHHEESWQPAWGIRTALVAIRSFMDTDAKGQIGGIDTSTSVRERFARESRQWRCEGCGGKTNEIIMQERDNEVSSRPNTAQETSEQIPEELHLAFREDLESRKAETHHTRAQHEADLQANQRDNLGTLPVPSGPPDNEIRENSMALTNNATPASVQPSRVTSQAPQLSIVDKWLDIAIGGVAAALVIMLLRNLGQWL